MHRNEENQSKKTYGSNNQIKNQVNMDAGLQSFFHSEVSCIFKTLDKWHHSPVWRCEFENIRITLQFSTERRVYVLWAYQVSKNVLQ